ncbi:dTDP-6-deoxy-L-hexose 3-O-methyltransferase, partial [Salmonella enterica subsp. enterica serovar Dublin]
LQGVEPVSNHDELALYYLQGQKDGLEWAAQLAEANHPLTGDWLYDDPLELAKAIRKGPDMPGFAGSSPVTPDG